MRRYLTGAIGFVTVEKINKDRPHIPAPGVVMTARFSFILKKFFSGARDEA